MLTTAAEVLAHHPYMHDGGWWPIFPLFWALFWVVGIVLLFRFFRRRGGYYHHHRRGAEDVLAERYASGDITVDEYRQRLDVLRERSDK